MARARRRNGKLRRPEKKASRGCGNRLAAIFLPMPFVIAGLFGCLLGYQEDRLALRSLAWTPKTAVIESVERARKGSILVTYRYEVAGETYRSNKIHFGTTRTSAYAGEVRQRYLGRAGQSVPVYVDPEDPLNAALEAGRKPGMAVLPGFCFVLLVAGIGMWVLLWTHRNDPTAFVWRRMKK